MSSLAERMKQKKEAALKKEEEMKKSKPEEVKVEKRSEPTTTVILPKFFDIVEFVEKWKQEHQGPYKLKCTICGEEYQEIVKKCKNNCVAYTKTTKKKKKTTLQSYHEEVWPYEKTLIRNPRQWKGLIQSILDIAEMIVNER